MCRLVCVWPSDPPPPWKDARERERARSLALSQGDPLSPSTRRPCTHTMHGHRCILEFKRKALTWGHTETHLDAYIGLRLRSKVLFDCFTQVLCMLLCSLCLTENCGSLGINPYIWFAVIRVLISVSPRSWWSVWAQSLKAADPTLAFALLLFLLLFTCPQLLALSDLCLTFSSPFPSHPRYSVLSPVRSPFFLLLSILSDRRETERGEGTAETPVHQPQSDNSSAAV